MANNNQIQSKSKSDHFRERTWSNLKGGLKFGLALGLGASIFLAVTATGIGLLVAAVPPLLTTLKFVAFASLSSAAVGGIGGSIMGMVKGIFTKPRPDGKLHRDENQQGQAAQPTVQQSVSRAQQMDMPPQPMPVGQPINQQQFVPQSAALKESEIGQLTGRLNESRARDRQRTYTAPEGLAGQSDVTRSLAMQQNARDQAQGWEGHVRQQEQTPILASATR